VHIRPLTHARSLSSCRRIVARQMVMPGEDAAVTIELISKLPIEEGQRFTVREGQKTVGTGIVSKIIE